MKQLLTSLLLGLSVLASAQNDGIQYPFPYNPDGNSDGYISLNDMLDLLSVYGQEYPQSFATDTSRAVLNLGRMGAHVCKRQAELAGRAWRVMTKQDLYLFAELAVNTFTDDGFEYTWTSSDFNGQMVYTRFIDKPISELSTSVDYIVKSDSTVIFDVQVEEQQTNGTIYLRSKYRCLIVSEVKPEYEFSYCITVSGGDFTTCVTDKLNDGWIPMPGGTKNSPSQFYQGFWRIVED